MKKSYHGKKLFEAAVFYFYCCETKKEAKEKIKNFTDEQVDSVDTLIREYNNDEFLIENYK